MPAQTPALELPNPDNVDLWQVYAPDLMPALNDVQLLSQDEQQRADRFKFPIHRDRFIITHTVLRKLLACYTQTPPNSLVFGHGEHDKPFLKTPRSTLQFNLSHSNDIILIAITQNSEIGVDIEQIKPDIDIKIAERYFHPSESTALTKLPINKRASVFFRYWAGKEAIVKMTGTGVANAFADFSINPLADRQSITLTDNVRCHLAYVPVAPAYVSAVARYDALQAIRRGQWTRNGPVLMP